MKRSLGSCAGRSYPPAKKRGVQMATMEKWKLKRLNTKTWLEYQAADKFHVAKMKCLRLNRIRFLSFFVYIFQKNLNEDFSHNFV